MNQKGIAQTEILVGASLKDAAKELKQGSVRDHGFVGINSPENRIYVYVWKGHRKFIHAFPGRFAGYEVVWKFGVGKPVPA